MAVTLPSNDSDQAEPKVSEAPDLPSLNLDDSKDSFEQAFFSAQEKSKRVVCYLFCYYSL